MAVAAVTTSTADSLNQQLSQVEQELQAIKNHQAIQPISIFHWSEPKLWLLLLLLGIVLLCLNTLRRRAKRARKVTTPAFDRRQAEAELRQALDETPLAAVVKPRKRSKS